MQAAKTHKQAERHRFDDRPSAAKRGYNARWQRASKLYLKKYPLCVDCRVTGYTEPATVVDHIIPHRGDMKLFWQQSNWQGLCVPHHNAKSAREKREVK